MRELKTMITCELNIDFLYNLYVGFTIFLSVLLDKCCTHYNVSEKYYTV